MVTCVMPELQHKYIILTTASLFSHHELRTFGSTIEADIPNGRVQINKQLSTDCGLSVTNLASFSHPPHDMTI
jgi:hypothetical protein